METTGLEPEQRELAIAWREWTVGEYEPKPSDFASTLEQADYEAALVLAFEDAEDHHLGSLEGMETLADWVENNYTEMGMTENIPDWLTYHIDWDGVALDLQISGEIFVSEKNHIFWV